MIVNKLAAGWQIIFQRAHGLLAAKIAAQIAPELRPPEDKWIDTLSAIAEHDDGQQHWKGKNHLSENGAPQDFTFHPPDLEQARAVVASGIYKSKWIALLTSMHTYHLYIPFKKDKKVKEFLKEQEDHQVQLRKTLQISSSEAEKAYNLMRWCDECSLMLCKNQLLPQGRHAETGELPEGTKRYLFQRENGTLGVEPWCFRSSNFTLTIEVFEVEQLKFTSDEELLQHLRTRAPRIKKWEWSK